MKRVTNSSQRRPKCAHCGQPFLTTTRGRPQRYCRPSHRVRAYEKRRLESARLSETEKLYRLLKKRLAALIRWRIRCNRVPGLDEIRRFAKVNRNKAYQQAVDGVNEILVRLAPEVFQDLVEPWRAALKGLEANREIERLEESAPWSR
jgi:hypothetical protein